MATVAAYWRPNDIQEALKLLSRPHAVAIGGGTKVNASRGGEAVEIVDLQALHLDRIERVTGPRLRIGAGSTLQELADAAAVPGAIRDAARRELPSTLRAQATLGGTLVTRDWESELLAALLVHDAMVEIEAADGRVEIALPELLATPAQPRGIVVALTLDADGATSTARTSRTRADRPIVAAVARRDTLGATHLALSGVAATPVLVNAVEDLDPPSDHRGSRTYRRSLAVTLSRRALEAVS